MLIWPLSSPMTYEPLTETSAMSMYTLSVRKSMATASQNLFVTLAIKTSWQICMSWTATLIWIQTL